MELGQETGRRGSYLKSMFAKLKEILFPPKIEETFFEIDCEECGERINVWTHKAICPHPSVTEWLGVEPQSMDEINKKKTS